MVTKQDVNHKDSIILLLDHMKESAFRQLCFSESIHAVRVLIDPLFAEQTELPGTTTMFRINILLQELDMCLRSTIRCWVIN